MEIEISRLILDVLDSKIESNAVETLLSSLSISSTELTCKDFGNISYHSSQIHGISLQVETASRIRKCKAIDIHNDTGVKDWSAFVGLPLKLDCFSDDGIERTLFLQVDTKGVDIVSQLGEPHRKGGGEPLKGGGASGLGPGAWME